VVEGTVQICGGVVAGIHRGPSSVPAALDFEGDYLIPGLIDIHTDNLERLLMPRKTVDWPVLAALVAHDSQVAAAGITTVLDALCVGTLGDGVRSFEKVKEAIALTDVGKRNRMFRSEHLLHLRAELTNEKTPGMFAQLHEHPDLVLVSIMDHTPGQRQYADMERFIAIAMPDGKQSEEQFRKSLHEFQEN
jgi:alpha-D-ribose 1-methylphosphonate 5-triphosphate diphosphatase